MAWVRLDDQFASNPKVLEAGPLGMALQVAALCYCNRHLTDGRLSRPAAATLLTFEGIGMHMWQGEIAGGGEDACWQLVATELVDVGVWHEPGHDCAECPPIQSGYYLHAYLDFQPSREQVETERKAKSAAGKRGASARWESGADGKSHGRGHSKTDGKSHGTSDADSMAESCPDPDPVPDPCSTPPPPPQSESTALALVPYPSPPTASCREDPGPSFDDFWPSYPKRNGKRLGKPKAFERWKRLSPDDRRAALVGARFYAAACDRGLNIAKDPERWVRDRCWEDWQEPAEPSQPVQNARPKSMDLLERRMLAHRAAEAGA